MIEKILIVDDDKMICGVMKTSLERLGLTVVCTHSGEAAVEALTAERDFQLCFCDIQLPRMNGLEVLERARNATPDMLVAMMTARDDGDTMQHVLTKGAFDVLVKPFTNAQAESIITKANQYRRLLRENCYMKTIVQFSKAPIRADGDPIFGNSYQVARVKQLCRRAADSTDPVLIVGERGTGKKLVADEFCRLSDPDNRKLRVHLNCKTVPAETLESVIFGSNSLSSADNSGARIGLLEIADNGILLLEHVCALPPLVQEKLVQFLRSGTFTRVDGAPTVTSQARLLVSSRIPLKREVKLERFNSDLYSLLKPLTIDLAPLRERNNDVTVVAKKLLKRNNELNGRNLGFSAQALDRMSVYEWPGNLDELEQFVARLTLVAKGPVITAEDLPNEMLRVKPVKVAVAEADVNRMFNIREIERLTIIRALKETKGNRSKAAELLGFTSRTLRNKLVEYDDDGIWDDDFDPKKKRRAKD